MKTEIVDVSPTRKEIKIEIAPEDLRAEYERVTQEFARGASVPGFRKGHAPISVLRTRFKKEIRAEVLQKLIPAAVNQAIGESGLNVIGEPDVHLDNEGLDNFGQQPIGLHAHVEVLPEITLGQYKGLEGVRRVRPVTEETINRVIEDLRESSASLQPVEERGAEAGDTVTVDIRGRYIDPPEEEDIKAEDVELVIDGEGVLAEFNDNLRGARPDDARTFTVMYPEDFKAQGLAGKQIEYTATVMAVRRKEVPEMDDEWVRSLGEEEVDSIEKLQERVRYESEHRLREELLDKLIATHEFEVPETLVEYQANQLMQQTVRDMMRRGMDPRSEEFNWERFRDMMRARAVEDLRGSMLLERIADEENIEVTDEEIEAEIHSIAEASKQTVEQVRDALTKQGGERSIADRLRNRKALDILLENAQVREEEWREEVPGGDPAATPTAEAESDAAASGEAAAGTEASASSGAATTAEATPDEAR